MNFFRQRIFFATEMIFAREVVVFHSVYCPILGKKISPPCSVMLRGGE